MKTCPLCKREMLDDGYSTNFHHLKPKCKKGSETVELHKICHNKIHSVFTENELLKYYHTIERLLAYNEMAEFMKWVGSKPPDFYVKTKQNARKRRR